MHAEDLVTTRLYCTIILSAAFLVYRRHLLKSLILLEGIVLRAILSITCLVASHRMTLNALIVVLTGGVVGASLGLSLLTTLCRRHGKDFTYCQTLV